MKKSIIAMAVAGALAVPAIASADATLYGKLEAVMQKVKNEDMNLFMDDVQLGVRGTADNGMDNVTSFYQIEVEFNENKMSALGDGTSSLDVRQANIGLMGDFGTVIVGRFSNPTDKIEGYGDVSNKAGNYAYNPDRLGNAIGYITPSFNGFSAYAGLVMEGQDGANPDESLDGYVVGADYSANNLNLSVGYWNFDRDGSVTVDATDDLSNLLVGGSYTFNNLTFGLMHERLENADEEGKLTAASLQYELNALTPYLQYAKYSGDTILPGQDDEGKEWALGMNYALGAAASVGVEYSRVNYDADTLEDTNQFNVSYTVKF